MVKYVIKDLFYICRDFITRTEFESKVVVSEIVSCILRESFLRNYTVTESIIPLSYQPLL